MKKVVREEAKEDRKMNSLNIILFYDNLARKKVVQEEDKEDNKEMRNRNLLYLLNILLNS